MEEFYVEKLLRGRRGKPKMIPALIPQNEQVRLTSLRNMNILDTPIEERFERITRMVCRSLNVPIAAISLIDSDRQWFKSIHGLEVPETSRELAFCSHAILEDEMMVVPDAAEDARFADNPLVTHSPHIRFYAGEPLTLQKNIRLGTLCAIDSKPRTLTSDEAEVMRDLGRMVESEFAAEALSEQQSELIYQLDQAQRRARLDGLTRLWNRAGIEEVLEREWDFACRESLPISLAMVDFDNFKQINDVHGHLIGDEVIRKGSRSILSGLRSSDAVGRWGGDEFLIVLPGCGSWEADQCLARIQAEISGCGPVPFTITIGAASAIPAVGDLAANLLKKADDALLAAKKNGKACFEFAV